MFSAQSDGRNAIPETTTTFSRLALGEGINPSSRRLTDHGSSPRSCLGRNFAAAEIKVSTEV